MISCTGGSYIFSWTNISRHQLNLTYNMLDFALEYHMAIDTMMNDQNNDLQKLELNRTEWKIVGQLCDILEVTHHSMVHLIILA